MVTTINGAKKDDFGTKYLTCDIPQKAYFSLHQLKPKICYLAQKITYVNIYRIIFHVIRIHDFAEHISVLVTKTKPMPTP
jgi:hypothetical protein